MELLCSYVATGGSQSLAPQTVAQRVYRKSAPDGRHMPGFYDKRPGGLSAPAHRYVTTLSNIPNTGHSLGAWGASARSHRRSHGDGTGEVAALRRVQKGIAMILEKLPWTARLFGKPSALDPRSFAEMADDTVWKSSAACSFPWPKIPRSCVWHQRAGSRRRSGYPDAFSAMNTTPTETLRIARGCATDFRRQYQHYDLTPANPIPSAPDSELVGDRHRRENTNPTCCACVADSKNLS